MYTYEDVIMLVQDGHTELSTCAWNNEYLYVVMKDNYTALGILLSKDHVELLKDTLDVFVEGGYANEDVAMLVQYKCTELSTYVWNDEYLHVLMRDNYDVVVMMLSKDHAELLKDTLDVFLEGGYVHE